ncbi:MAG TPA: diguanylate cyclase [Egibacteraceae bacterium]|nr:diguanylate cyclase [Egibacteraceae bacterium]
MRALEAGEHELAFWQRHVRIGVSLSQLTLGVCLVYTLRYADPSRRGVLLALIGIAFASTLGVNLLPLRRILSGRAAVPFFAAWSALLTLLIVLGSLGDGGGDTPLALLYFMPVVYGAIAYPPGGVIALGIAVVGAAVVTRIVGGGSPGGTLMLGGTLALVTTMCAVSARNHWRTTRSQTALAERLAHLADHDGLTGCLNHRAFHERLRQEAARAVRYERALGLLLVDLDGFKAVNDGHGHPCGDAVLAAVGDVLRATTRDTDIVGRVGGDEFAVLLPETGCDEAHLLAERIRAAVGALREPVPVTASIGVAALPPAHDAATLLAAADVAVYQAKRSGRDYVVVHGDQPAARQQGGSHALLRERVHEVVDGGRLTALFQPIVCLADGSVLGYEALTRVDESSLGPAQWLDLAERAGVRDSLEAAMWRTALAAGPPPDAAVLFLNAGPEALLSGAMAEFRGRLGPHAAIEVSEHDAIADYGLLSGALAPWIGDGARIAVDDMGAGHANLAHVLNLGPHYLKLDRSLVEGLHEHPSRRALLESLITFAARIGSELVAEGVELEQEAEALAAAGVRYAQGYLFGRPQAPWAAVAWRPHGAEAPAGTVG